MGVAQAQEMLKGKVVVAQGICENESKQYDCLLVADPKRDDVGWLVLINNKGEPQKVFEINSKGEAKEVWDKQKKYL